MSSKGTALKPLEAQPFIEQVAGRDKGKIFELSANQVSIGRAKDNDIIVPSDAVSRNHAQLLQGDGGWLIRDNGSKNGVLVNGARVQETWLRDGDVVQVGDFVFRFAGGAAVANMQPSSPAVEPLIQTSVAASALELGMKPKRPKSRVSKRPLLYGGVVIVLALTYWIGSGTPKPTDLKKDQAEQTNLKRDFKPTEPKEWDYSKKGPQIIGLDDPLLKRAEQDMAKLDWSNTGLQKAEQLFRRGQREYLNQNYQRAMEYFQTALSFYQGHLLADRYLALTMSEAEYEAKRQMATAIQYFESLQYQRAMHHFREVITLMAHRPQEPIVDEARKYTEQCKRRLQAAELFP